MSRIFVRKKMPSAKVCRAPRKVDTTGMVGAMRSRQEKNNLSELAVNWIGKGHLNALESDLMYKYHVAHLSDVYAGRSRVNNDTPRSVSNPPPWANLDPRVLSPIPDKEKREANWDNQFSSSNCCLQNEARPAAGRHSYAVSSGRIKNGTRPRPASAGVRRGSDQAGATNRRDGNAKRGGRARPLSANVHGREPFYGESDGCGGERNAAEYCTVGATSRRRRRHPSDGSDFYPGVCGGRSPRESFTNREGGNNRRNNSVYSAEDMEILSGGYNLDDNQESVFRKFVALLVDFDSCSAADILRDAFREAQLASGLHNFTGCGPD